MLLFKQGCELESGGVSILCATVKLVHVLYLGHELKSDEVSIHSAIL